tara:strand:+ start:589 stop:1308 length:720 start_codon:yes stop_codon:yes gene_type:complete
MKSIKYNFFEKGYVRISSKGIKSDLIEIKKIFKNKFLKKFNTKLHNNNLNLITRFAGEPLIYKIINSAKLKKTINLLGIKEPVLTGPIVTHYTSNNDTSRSHGLDYHYDWNSMATSTKGIIVWFNINNFIKNNQFGLEVLEKSHNYFSNNSKNLFKNINLDKMKNTFKKINLSVDDELLIMSTFLMHKTVRNNKINPNYWRLGISIRVDDLSDSIWKKNNYCSAYGNSVDRELYKKYKF